MTSETAEKLRNKLQRRFGKSGVLELDLKNFFSEMRFLRFEANFILLLDICGVDRIGLPRKTRHRFELTYILLNMEEHYRLQIKINIDDQNQIPSVSKIWENAKWCEREIGELLGIPIEDAEKESLFLPIGFEGYPLRKDFAINPKNRSKLPRVKKAFPVLPPTNPNTEWVELGPTHPAVMDNIRIFLLLKGEEVCDAKCEVGLLHRGVEKLLEQRNYQQITPYTERLNYNSPSINSVGWCMTVEKAAQLQIPDRAKAMRMVLMEFSRISDHLLCLGISLLDAGAIKNYHDCLELRKHVCKTMQSYSGPRHLNGAIRIGGLACDLPPGWITATLEVTKWLSLGIKRLHLAIVQGRSWMEKTKSNPINASDAINWGLTGPTLRACGVNYDLRKTNPYYFYEDVDFEIPLGINGDAYDRFLVRLEEMNQSLKIIIQVLDNLPSGKVFTEDKQWQICGQEVPKLPEGELYHFIEAANGELGFFLVSDGKNTPYRLKIRPPSLALGQAYSKIAQNSWYEKALLTFTSLNIVPGEIDR